MKIRYFLAALVAVILAACATVQPQTPAQAVYQVKSNYAAALEVAVAYTRLPRCTEPVTVPICSRYDVIVRLQQADRAAAPALDAAEKVVRAPDAGANPQTAILAAQQAVAALTAITSTLKVKQ